MLRSSRPTVNQSKNGAIEIPMAFVPEAGIAFGTCKGYLVPIDNTIFENVALSGVKIKDR